MISTSYKQALEVLHLHGKTLTAMNFSCGQCAFLLHEEGTTLFFRSAFLLEWKDWVFVYTEHHGEIAYHKTDLSAYWNLSRTAVQKLATGHFDKCEECGAEHPVEQMFYNSHPDCDKFDAGQLVLLCPACVRKYHGEEEDGNVSAPADPV